MITKSDLKLGDILVTRCKFYYLFLNTPRGKRLLGNCGWMDIEGYREDLTRKNDYFWDIEKVYRPINIENTFQNEIYSLDYIRDFHQLIKRSVDITNKIIDTRKFINISDYV